MSSFQNYHLSSTMTVRYFLKANLAMALLPGVELPGPTEVALKPGHLPQKLLFAAKQNMLTYMEPKGLTFLPYQLRLSKRFLQIRP